MRTTAIIIGAGHAGLAMSRCLTAHAIDHVVLERGDVAHSWKTERWDALRLLTPNWMSRLPGYGYTGDAPNGYRTLPEVITFLERYATVNAMPVQTQTTVTAVRYGPHGYTVATDQGEWDCRAVVLASGACNIASVPACATAVPATVTMLTTKTYRHPEQLAEGGVLVVGASASGVQIAEEVHRSGRPVTLAVGEHVRAPRTYRDRDIQWWMEVTGMLDERYDAMDNLARVRRLPSMQLVGSDTHRSLDLNTLTDMGITLVGRLAGMRDGTAQFSGSLQNMCTLADLKMDRLLEKIDAWVANRGLESQVGPPCRFAPTRVAASPPLSLDLQRGAIRTILWAAGYRPEYTWLDVPVLDAQGRVRHDGGVMASPGMYIIGLPVLRCRRSTFIDGAANDAQYLSAHLAAYLAQGSVTQAQIGAGLADMVGV
ncbi:MAG: pyridine nucleotide-disulfide oxidoreductase [Candidatus Tectomicrobia bacterium]|uniref:Pyridine nucleotide-disulfide oxidoreductase n=1 Tax=Tectimicrobiota bacterium TaxID=2528274 RepID=A0A938B3Y0_UNCTE|nr:pyridine nucleotide-disulfide oxidoreductase [Candidatus Tectomicrobia bacterium]